MFKVPIFSRRFQLNNKTDACHFVFLWINKFFTEWLAFFFLAYYFTACKYSLKQARAGTHKYQKVPSTSFFGTVRQKNSLKIYETPILMKNLFETRKFQKHQRVPFRIFFGSMRQKSCLKFLTPPLCIKFFDTRNFQKHQRVLLTIWGTNDFLRKSWYPPPLLRYEIFR